MNLVHAVRFSVGVVWALLCSLGACIQFQSARLYAQPGAEDASFVAVSGGNALALQTNGHIVVSGDRLPRRLLPNGAIDPSFYAGEAANNTVRAILIQPDGRILIGGSFTQFNRTSHFYLLRLNPDGSVDASFRPESMFSPVNALALQPDGRILVGASGLYRLLDDGRADPAFAPTLRGFAVSVIAVLPNGKILVNGPFPDSHRLKRLHPDGSLDTNFVLQVSIVDALAIQPDSKLLIAGQFDSSSTQLRRFDPEGSPDSSFAPVTLKPEDPWSPSTIRAILPLPEGSIVVPGDFHYVNERARAGIARLHADGSPDLEFDAITGFDTSIHALALQADGKLLVGGNFRRALEGTIQTEKALVRLLLDNDPASPGRLEFSELKVAVEERRGQVTVAVRRTGGSAGTVSAEYYIKPDLYWGSANAGRDYVPTSGTLTFYGGETTKTFTVTLIDNNVREGNRNFFVGLHGLSGGAIVGSQYQAEVVIVDDDAVLEFAAAQLYGLEGGPAVAVNVIRRGYTNSTVSVVSHVRNGTAIGGEDFWGISAHLDFGPGETNKTFLIPIINDEIREPAEEVMLILENPSVDASLGWYTNAVLTIHDDDSPGSLDPGFPLGITNFVNHAVPLSQGGILIATHFEFYPGNVKPQLLQFSPAGTLEREFDNSLFIPGRRIGVIAAQADGRVLVSTPLANDVSLLRFNRDGTLDPTFQPRGLGYVNHVVIQADGKILLTGSRSAVTRLRPNGSLDPSFVLLTNNNTLVTAIALQADGKILLGRQWNSVSSNSFIRLNVDGSIDTSFLSDVTQALSPSGVGVENIVVEPDGNILVIGSFRVGAGRSAKQLRRLDSLGRFTSDSPVGLAPSEPATMTGSSGKIVVASAPGSLFRVNADLSADETFVHAQLRQVHRAPAFNSVSLSQDLDQHILVAGGFDAVNDIPRPGFARIKNDDLNAGMVVFATNAITFHEAYTAFIIGVRRTGGSNGLVSANYGAAAQTASAGTDFTERTGVITFADGEAGEKLIGFNILNDEAGEGNETFQLTLANPLGGVTLGPNAACQVTILDNDTTVGFASTDIKIFETSGTIPVSIIREGVLSHATRIEVAAVSGTAKAGEDYVAPPMTIDFAPGETNKIIHVSVVDDLLQESDEAGFLAIASASGGHFADRREVTRIEILDNERPGSVDGRFQQPEFAWSAYGSWIKAMALQSDGKIVVGGYFSYLNGELALAIARLLPDGTRDTSLQVNDPSLGMMVGSVAVQPDGKILFTHRPAVSGHYLGRLESNGSRDGTFFARVDESINTLQVQPSGKIVIAGWFTWVNGVARNSIARLQTNGMVDEAFATGAGVQHQGNAGIIRALARQNDAKWLIGGQFTSVHGVRRTNIARLHSNGTLDATFNAGVMVGRDSASYVSALAIQPNGKILVGGHFDPSPLASSRGLVRLLSNGALDVNFNAGGRGIDPKNESEISTIRIQRDGRILISGFFEKFNQTPRNSLARLLWNGALDPSFKPALWDVPVRLFDMLVQPNDEILVAGDFDYYGMPPTGVARINPGIVDFKMYEVRRPIGGVTSFRFQVPPGTIYDLQRSADLVQWRSLVLISNQIHWTDSNSAAVPKRFYRAVRTSP